MNDTYERDLTPREIEERTKLRDELDDERDSLLTAIEDRRREIRGFNASRKKLEARIRDVRRELRSGKVIESRQLSIGLATIAPIEPVEQGQPDAFEQRYPMALDAERLHRDLSLVLQGVLVPSVEKLAQWHPATGIFQGIAHWARTELAYMNRKEIEKFHPEIELPPRGPMPVKLDELRVELGRAAEQHRKGRSKRKPEGDEPAPPARRAAKKAKRTSKREVRA